MTLLLCLQLALKLGFTTITVSGVPTALATAIAAQILVEEKQEPGYNIRVDQYLLNQSTNTISKINTINVGGTLTTYGTVS